ncbi:hypothetical protein ACPWT1_18525 [Ramlibacter sp. MMS24-I3-19]|uniref:hypothetical protein n=1 Tax=Ramlibacter sp. MMS24-I3-19 TaxID=3416606 RepID=UPI003CFC1B82
MPYSIASANKWLDSEIGRKIVFDTWQGALDIQFAQLPETEAQYDEHRALGGVNYKRQWIEYDLALMGLVRPGQKYLVFYEGGDDGYCGESALPGDAYDKTALVFLNGVKGTCAIWPRAAAPDAAPSWVDDIPFHELFHLFGAMHTPQILQTQTMDEYTLKTCDLMYDPQQCGNTGRRYVDRYRMYYYNPAGFSDPARPNLYFSPYFTPVKPQ